MIYFTLTADDFIKDITFDKNFDFNLLRYGNKTHEEFATQIADFNLVSVIIDMDRLDETLWDDPKYMKQETHIWFSKIREEARRRMMNRYMPMEDTEKLIQQAELTTRANNWSDESKKSELLDRIFEAQEFALYPEIIDSHKEGHKEEYDEETDEYKPRVNWEESWDAELIKLLMPRTAVTYERVYSMPEPFNHWDSRNRFQQWYFVDGGEKGIGYLRGGSGSSSARLEQGLGAHTFAFLASRGKKIPTWHLTYNGRNELLWKANLKEFKAVDR